jgi:uncharacterized membrane protein YcaP (DUF421 family)
MNIIIIKIGEIMELIQVIIRTLFFYFFVLICYRIMGKREVGQLGVIDLIVSILIAELMAISIENTSDSLFMTIIPIIILVLLEISLAYISIKSRKFRLLLDGKPALIICNGKVNYHEMIKQRYNLDDLLLELRQKEIKNIDDVEYAFLEPNGKLSIFKYNILKIKSSYPIPLILDGVVQYKALNDIKKNERWLINALSQKGFNINNIFYCYYKRGKLFIIKKDYN